MTEDPWNTHTPGDPMPCKCGDSVVETEMRGGWISVDPAADWIWAIISRSPEYEIIRWRFIERKGEDVIAADPYSTLEWDEDGITTVVLKEPGQPEWVRDNDPVRFDKCSDFRRAHEWHDAWSDCLAFQIKRRPILTPAVPELLALLYIASPDEADAIRAVARRANIEVPE